MKLFLALIVVVPAIAIACGGGNGAEKTPAAGQATVAGSIDATSLAETAVANVVVPGPTRSPDEATAVATLYDLEDYHHDAAPRREGSDIIDFPYVIPLPKGWTTTTIGVTVTSSLTPAGAIFPVATITVDCRPGVTKSEMLAVDASVAAKGSFGNLAVSNQQSVTVGGRDAIRVAWQGGVFPADRTAVYVDGQSCAWRLQLSALGSLKADDFAALFGRILDRFNPAQGLPAGG